jgi:uncharacterized membrane protein
VPRSQALLLVLLCTVLNTAGFMFNIFEPVPLYDEIVHFLTPFTLVAITAEIIYRSGGDDVFFNTPRHALLTGAGIGFLGAGGWEIIEVLIDAYFPGARIYHALPDTIFDIVLGVAGGALGAWAADRYLDRLFRRSRRNPRRRAVL